MQHTYTHVCIHTQSHSHKYTYILDSLSGVHMLPNMNAPHTVHKDTHMHTRMHTHNTHTITLFYHSILNMLLMCMSWHTHKSKSKNSHKYKYTHSYDRYTQTHTHTNTHTHTRVFPIRRA